MGTGWKKWLAIIVVLACVAGVFYFFAHMSRSVVIGSSLGQGTSTSLGSATTTAKTTTATITATTTQIGAGQNDATTFVFNEGQWDNSTTTRVDAATYDAKMLAIANVPFRKYTVTSTITVGTSTRIVSTTTLRRAPSFWPVKNAPYPLAGALLPFNRIVAYYGNFYSTQMGVLGQYPPDQMIAMLASTSAAWAAADPSTPVIPALDYIAVSAQGSAGPDGKYRLRMPPDQIQKAIDLVAQLHGIVFLDLQVGLSNVETEVPLLADFLKLPNVELSLDPEFDMHNGARPGTVIGTMDASDINFAANFLANLVQENNLPPKILVIHRFTEPMVTNYKNIMPLPQVQIVMDMDGFGPPAEKLTTYADFIVPEPVQFTGFKIFYKNDVLVPGSHLLTPKELLQLSPQPSYIQYQ
jgi:hypothetical protein